MPFSSSEAPGPVRGSGLGTTAQAVPSKCSMSVRSAPALVVMLPTAHTSPVLTSSTPSSWAPVAPAGIGTAAVLHARPSQCSARGWLLAERASDAPTAQASVALPAATELKITSFRPSMPPGFGGLPAIRHGLETGPAGGGRGRPRWRRAERERGHAPGHDPGGAGQAGDRDQGRAGRAPPFPSCPSALSPQPLTRPPATTASENEPPAAIALALPSPGTWSGTLLCRDPAGEAVPPGELELAVVAPHPDRTVRQQGHRVLLPAAIAVIPVILATAVGTTRRLTWRPTPSCPDSLSPQAIAVPLASRPASAARRPRSRLPRTGP